MKLSPAILTDDFLLAQQEIEAVKYSSLIDAVHIDVIDGQFVDNTTIVPMDLTVSEFEPLKLDFHFMTEEPQDFVFECEALAEYLPIRRMIAQVERMTSQKDYLETVKKNNWQAGLALNIFTPFEAIDEELWSELDVLLLLGVEAGYQQQGQHPYLLEKLSDFSLIKPHLKLQPNFSLVVDGGVKLTNAPELIARGAQELVVGSAIWNSADPLLAIEEFFTLTDGVVHE